MSEKFKVGDLCRLNLTYESFYGIRKDLIYMVISIDWEQDGTIEVIAVIDLLMCTLVPLPYYRADLFDHV